MRARANTAMDNDPVRGTARTQTEPTNRLTKATTEHAHRAYSFSPGRRDSIRASKPPHEATARSNMRRRSKKATQVSASLMYTDDIHRVPTLHHENSGNKRSGQPLLAKKSSKRRKEDHEREAEIRAMSQFTPLRPATNSVTKGRPMKKESRRVKPDLARSWDGHPSAVSLPSPGSIHSSMSSDSDHISFRVSAFAALAPRPTIRCSSNPVAGMGIGRSASERRRLAEREPITEATLKAHKRIDDLADNLDASDLRELMERDQRRRQRKREKDMQKAERRLARKMESQRDEAARGVGIDTPPQNLERGMLGRELTGLEDPASVTVTSSRRRRSVRSNEANTTLEAEKPASEGSSSERQSSHRSPTPLGEFYRTNSGLSASRHAVEGGPSPPLQEDLRPKSTSPSNPSILNFIRSRKSRSKSPEQDEIEQHVPRASAVSTSPPRTRPDYAESATRTSESGSARPWLSFLKWGGKRRRSMEPSSFSNTSRDSMQGSQTGLPPPASFTTGRRLSSGVPKRTMSRFREDLPEHPLSPPDSRVGSPDAYRGSSERLPQITDDADRPLEADMKSPTSPIPIPARRQESQLSPVPHSMSLASVDSEGSWLSGRMSRQSRQRASSSAIGPPIVHPMASTSVISEVQHSDHSDDDSIVADEYLNKMVPSSPIEPNSDHAHASSDEESLYEAQWGSVSRKPTMVRGAANLRSREGLLLQGIDDKALEDGGSLHTNEQHAIVTKSEEAKLLELSSSEQPAPMPERATQ